MKLHEIDDNVIPFPQKGKSASTVDVPKGYSSFYTKKAGPTTSHIMGIRPDGTHVSISTTSHEVADALAKAYNRGGVSDLDIRPVSMSQAFGSEAAKAFGRLGVRFVEKPSNWEEIKQEATCSRDQLWKVGEMLGGLPEVHPGEMFLRPRDALPMNAARSELPDTVVLSMPNGDTFVGDRGGSRNYYRRWLYVRPHGLSVVP